MDLRLDIRIWNVMLHGLYIKKSPPGIVAYCLAWSLEKGRWIRQASIARSDRMEAMRTRLTSRSRNSTGRSQPQTRDKAWKVGPCALVRQRTTDG